MLSGNAYLLDLIAGAKRSKFSLALPLWESIYCQTSLDQRLLSVRSNLDFYSHLTLELPQGSELRWV